MVSRSVGIDLGVRTKHRAVLLEDGKRVGKPFSVAMTTDGLERLLKGAAGFEETTFVMEPTGPSWLPLAAVVQHYGHTVFLAKPQKVHDYRKFLRRHTKTDCTDAEAAARLPQADPRGVLPAYLPTAQHTTLRRLVQRRDRATSEVASRKKRIKALVRQAQPGMVEALGDSWDTQAGRKLLAHYLDPRDVIGLGVEGLESFLREHGLKESVANKAEQLVEVAQEVDHLYGPLRDAGTMPFDYGSIQSELAEEIELIAAATERANRLEKEIVTQYGRLDPDRTLQQLRGVGPIIGAGVEAFVGNVQRFRNARAFVSYFGMCPRRNQTGGSDPNQPMTKAGNRLLKKYMYLAADIARQWDPEFAAYYARRYWRGDHHNLILIALARKMVLRIYALLRRRDEARRLAAAGTAETPSVTYELRTPEGQPISKREARGLIQERYSRKVLDQQSESRTASTKPQPNASKIPNENAGSTTVAQDGWPPESDATNATADTPQNKIMQLLGLDNHTRDGEVDLTSLLSALFNKLEQRQ